MWKNGWEHLQNLRGLQRSGLDELEGQQLGAIKNGQNSSKMENPWQ
jgi:hypothetical protein